MPSAARPIALLILGIVLALAGVALSWRLLIELVGLLLLVIGAVLIGVTLGFLRR